MERTSEEVKKFLAEAHQRFKLCEEAESELRKEALSDFKFLTGEQWDGEIKRKREEKNRPCLTTNRLPAFKKIITNEYRQQKPAIQVDPQGDGATDEVSEVIQGIIRHIDNISDAEIAYDTAFDHLVIGGFGFWRYVTDYIDDKTFDQEIYIQWIENPFSAYLDPFASKPDRSDANFGFVVEDPSPDEYKIKYPDSLLSRIGDFSGLGNAPEGWVSKECFRVAEYFYVGMEKTKLYEHKDGTISSDLEEGEKFVQERDVLMRKVKWAKINAIEILEERDWPGKFIPIVMVEGDRYTVNGKIKRSGMIRHAKDPQRMYNYWITCGTEVIALAPKAPFVAAAGQVEQYADQWERANTDPQSVLRYDPLEIGSTAVPPPQRDTVEPPIQAITLMIRQVDNDLKAVTGIYDASLGQRGPDESGKAILARQKQTDIAILDYSDNMARGMRFGGRILVDLIPKVYDRERLQRIISPDGTSKAVRIINSSAELPESSEQQPPEENQQPEPEESLTPQ